MCRVFTTHEQLAVSEEREAELAAAVQEAKQSAAAAKRALAAEQETVKCLQTAAVPSEQVGPSVSPPLHTPPHDLLFRELESSAVQQLPHAAPAFESNASPAASSCVDYKLHARWRRTDSYALAKVCVLQCSASVPDP